MMYRWCARCSCGFALIMMSNFDMAGVTCTSSLLSERLQLAPHAEEAAYSPVLLQLIWAGLLLLQVLIRVLYMQIERVHILDLFFLNILSPPLAQPQHHAAAAAGRLPRGGQDEDGPNGQNRGCGQRSSDSGAQGRCRAAQVPASIPE